MVRQTWPEQKVSGQIEPDKSSSAADPPHEPASDAPRSSARALLKYAGTWVGDDVDELLKVVQATRSNAAF